MYEDQIQEVNYAAFVSRAKQMIQENDPRPWETLQEELKVELLRPVVLPPDDQGRRIVIDESAIPTEMVPNTPPPQPSPEEPRRMNFD